MGLFQSRSSRQEARGRATGQKCLRTGLLYYRRLYDTMFPYNEALFGHIGRQLEAVAQVVQPCIFGEKLEVPQPLFSRIV